MNRKRIPVPVRSGVKTKESEHDTGYMVQCSLIKTNLWFKYVYMAESLFVFVFAQAQL